METYDEISLISFLIVEGIFEREPIGSLITPWILLVESFNSRIIVITTDKPTAIIKWKILYGLSINNSEIAKNLQRSLLIFLWDSFVGLSGILSKI